MARSILDSLSCVTAVGFVPASLQALVAACILKQTGRPVLWVVESVEAMEQAEDDLATFLGTERVMPFPPYDVRPYQDDSPSREVMARRISTLYGLLSRKAAVVVVPVQALCCYTLPAGDLSEALIDIRTGMEIDRDELAAGLVRMGYTREALVDDVGQFGIRGSVMDIFSPGMAEPVRLDLFGDEVKVLKSFDIRTQRTRRTLTTATVLPAGEVLLDSRHVRTARPLMRMRLKDRLRFVIEDMEQGIRTPGIESFLVLFSERPGTLFDYLPRETVILAPDPVEAGLLWDEVHTSFAHGYERALSLDRPALPPEDTLMTREDLLQRMERFSRRVSTSAASLDGPLARSVSGMGPPPGKSETAFERILSQTDTGMDVFIFTVSDMLAERVEYSLQTRGVAMERTDSEFLMRHAGFSGRVRLIEGNLSSGFILPGMGVALASAEELLGARRRKRKGPAGPPIYDPFTQLSVGDAVVHRDKGIGLFRGVVRLEVDGTTSDYVLLEYLGGDRLYIPVYSLSLLQRYVGDVDHYTVDRLGGSRWANARAKAQKSVAKLAGELLQLHAKRQAATGFAFDTTSPFIQEFADSFPYVETDDQLKAVEETYADLSAARPMDRLICGDVGYGKTEVALRAAFAAVMSGRQVAVLVPTTLLARQHLMTFRDRMAKWPIRIEALSSMGAAAGNRDLLADLAAGTVDIVIGTHGLLSDRVTFADLGLLIVDEEHRFGVRHKEKIKALRAEVDILTLTATPIPRTLNMAISGLRELSIIETPPADRKAIETAITRFDDEAVQAAVTRELQRGGQVFFVHNTVSTIEAMARRVQALCPQARVGVAHGQMPRPRLNRVMSSFLDRSITVLVSSAIISSGIDIPTANTIIINRADTFGLADLYQLRGRVGRSRTKGICLLLLPETGQITKDAQKRLAAIKEYESLGAGFQMAMRDMEIRGVGDILGKAQWGHVTAIGYELYQEMLREAVDLLQGKQPEASIDPEIRIRLDAYIPEDYCPDQHLRLGLYKRLFSASAEELESIGEELKDLYGPLPLPVRSLILISEIRDIMKRLRLRKAEMVDEVLRLYPSRDSIMDHGRVNAVIHRAKGRVLAGGALEFPLKGPDTAREIRDVFHALT